MEEVQVNSSIKQQHQYQYKNTKSENSKMYWKYQK